MSDGVVDSVKQVLEERLKNPLWGFIILAWFWFNWPNLAMLFMSDAPVKFRIDYILSQDYFYLHFIAAPILMGGILAVASPYAQWLLSKAHKWADDRSRDNLLQGKRKDFNDAIELSELKVRAERAVETENAKVDADILAEVERGKREVLGTQKLEKQKINLEKEIEMIERTLEIARLANKNALNQKNKLQDLIVKSLSVIEKYLLIDGRESVVELKNEINELFTVEEFEESVIRNALKDGRELTEEQTASLLQQLDKDVRRNKENDSNLPESFRSSS